MTLRDFLRGITPQQRASIAEDIGRNADYLRILSSAKDRHGSLGLANSILLSKTNTGLHPTIQFTMDDFLEHREASLERSNKRGVA